ncbi:hypothetical protein EDB19DRAFT_849579 [Suillus lakei]|nr:hypothetical protein EDB19DRAFT_849579 [Suillus lakei]
MVRGIKTCPLYLLSTCATVSWLTDFGPSVMMTVDTHKQPVTGSMQMRLSKSDNRPPFELRISFMSRRGKLYYPSAGDPGVEKAPRQFELTPLEISC